MKVFVTGATGFIGLNLVPHLQERGHTVCVLVRRGSPANRLPEGIETVQGNVADPDTYGEAVADADAIVHLAAKFEGEYAALEDVNVEATTRLYQRAADTGATRFVFASTIHAHPDVPAPSPGPYEETKAQAEQALRTADAQIPYSIVNPTYVIGPRDYRLSRHGYFRAVRSNAVLVPPLYPPDRFNIVHVDDVVHAMVHCLADEGNNQYVVSGPNMSSAGFHRKIATIVDGRHVVVPVPGRFYRGVVGPLVDRLYKYNLSPIPGDRFREATDIGTVPEAYANRAPVPQASVERALRDAYSWYESVGAL